MADAPAQSQGSSLRRLVPRIFSRASRVNDVDNLIRSVRVNHPRGDLSIIERAYAVAKEKQIPPYMVFSDATLVGIVEARPASVAQLGAVSGVGAKKLAEYGEAVLEALPDAPTG